MAKLSNLTINDTGALTLPDGTSDQRPGYVVKVFTANGPGNFTVPTGVTEVDVLVVGGGGGSAGIGGGGGAGGMIDRPGFPVTPGSTIPYSVGAGGAPGGTYPGPVGSNGSNSVFGSLTALGGGGAGSWNNNTSNPGGSGAGGPGTPGTGANGGAGNQPSQSGDSGAYGFGYPGSRGGTNPSSNSTPGSGTYTAGGGGGAGAAGGHPSLSGPGNTSTTNAGRKGGDGRSSSITGVPVYYAGGGGGGSHNSGYRSPVTTALGGIGGGGRGASVDWYYDQMGFYNFPATVYGGSTLGNYNPHWQWYGRGQGEPGRVNTGGGAGGGFYYTGGTGEGGTGGPGVIIVRYRNPKGQLSVASISGGTELNTSSAHGVVTNEIWVPNASGLGVVADTKYYVVEIVSATAFKVSTIKGGSPATFSNGSLGVTGTVLTADPENGMTRYNTAGGYIEIYVDNVWKPLKRSVVKFTATGLHNFKVPEGVTHVDVLVVAGGGSGGELGGGGGAGGLIYEQNVPVAPGGNVPVYVGTGGHNEMTHTPHHGIRKGEPSRFGGFEAYGGGAGANHPAAARSQPYTHNWWDNWGNSGDGSSPNQNSGGSPGGSGGGAAYTHPGGAGKGTPGQGYPGGTTPGSPPHSNAGGGGAGAAGGNGGGPVAGPGGDGRVINITGTNVHYAGGGGGGAHGPQGSAAPGGAGGGGGGGQRNNINTGYGAVYSFHQSSGGTYASPGADNTGGGGGGGGHNSSNPYGLGARGGPGIVIVRY